MSEAEATPAARIPRFAGAKRFQGLYVYAASGDTTDTRALQGGVPHVGIHKTRQPVAFPSLILETGIRTESEVGFPSYRLSLPRSAWVGRIW